MPLRCRPPRDRLSRALGLARSFRGQPARARCRLRHLCRQLAQAVSGGEGHAKHSSATRTRPPAPRAASADEWHAAVLRTATFAAYGEHIPRASSRSHRPPAALPHRHLGTAGLDLHRRGACPAERLSRRCLAALEKKTPRVPNTSRRSRMNAPATVSVDPRSPSGRQAAALRSAARRPRASAAISKERSRAAWS